MALRGSLELRKRTRKSTNTGLIASIEKKGQEVLCVCGCVCSNVLKTRQKLMMATQTTGTLAGSPCFAGAATQTKHGSACKWTGGRPEQRRI